MKIGILKERKIPMDKRVVFSPEALEKLKSQYPSLEIAVESSEIRCFDDASYQAKGFEISNDLSDCDVLFGVKEIPVSALIPNKKYIFFSHTIKKQAHNRALLQSILEKNITLIDHETLLNEKNRRLIGFGKYAGIVGAYNAIRAFGAKFELFQLPKASDLKGIDEMQARLKRIILPPIKIVVSGSGKVGHGVKMILDAMKIKSVATEDFLTKIYSKPVYCQIDVLDYNKRKDGQKLDFNDFYNNPKEYEGDFGRFTKVSDIYISAHFHALESPEILSQEMLKAADNKIKVVADISCDVDGPIACTKRASTIENPFYGYLPSTNEEVDFHHPGAIAVMAVDNLPCEIPMDASIGFGEMFIDNVMPAFFNEDKDGILAKATIAKNGELTEKFSYLEDFVKNS